MRSVLAGIAALLAFLVAAKAETVIVSGGGATALTVGSTAIASGTTTRILYDNAGVLGEYTLTGSGTVVAMQASPTFTGIVTTPALTETCGQTAAAWTTNGICDIQSASTITDTTSSGTVANVYVNVLGKPTLAASSATTYTRAYTQAIVAPAAGTNVTITNAYAQRLINDDTLTTSTVFPLRLMHTLSSGTAAANIGAGFEVGLQNGSGNLVTAGSEGFKLTTVTNGAEVSTYTLSLLNAGSVVTPLIVNGDGSATVSGNFTVSGTTTTVNNVSAGTVTIATGSSLRLRSAGTSITSPANATVTIGANPSAAPAANTLAVGEDARGGTDTNTAGGVGTIRAGLSTGNVSSPDLIFQTGGAVGASGTTLATATTALTLKGVTQNALFTGQLVVANMTQTSAAQSGTVCWAVGGITYDATLGCLASLPELKTIHGRITVRLEDIGNLKPYWFSWRKNSPEWKGGDRSIQPGFNAREVAAIPIIGPMLTANGPDGKLRGVRYAETVAYLQAEIITLKAANDNLSARLAKLERRR